MLKKVDNKNSQLALRLTENEFLVKYSPKNCITKFRNVKTVRMALKENVGSLAQIKKGYGPEFQITFIMLWLADLNESVGVKNKLNEDMMEQCAMFIIEDYYYLKISDINLIFSRAKKGAYGNFYESISIPKIMQWFSDYAEDRAEIAYSTNLNEHKQDKNKNPLYALVGVKTIQEKYFDELGKAKKTKDYTIIDKMLSERKNPTKMDFEQTTKDLEKKIKGHEDFILQIEEMKANTENPILANQYDGEIYIIQKQLDSVRTKLDNHLKNKGI